MKYIHMRTRNDCVTACYATVLQIPYEEVPRFFTDDDKPVPNWVQLRDRFLARHGLQSIHFDYTEELAKHVQGVVIVSVPSPTPEYAAKGYQHAVLFKDGYLWHDPDPKATGKHGEPITIELLVKLAEA